MTPSKHQSENGTDAPHFDWAALAEYKQEKRFLDHYPDDFRTFWSPRDSVHDLLIALLTSAQRSIVLNMFGYDDDDLDAIIRDKLKTQHGYVQMSLDKSQCGGKHEQEILKRW